MTHHDFCHVLNPILKISFWHVCLYILDVCIVPMNMIRESYQKRRQDYLLPWRILSLIKKHDHFWSSLQSALIQEQWGCKREWKRFASHMAMRSWHNFMILDASSLSRPGRARVSNYDCGNREHRNLSWFPNERMRSRNKTHKKRTKNGYFKCCLIRQINNYPDNINPEVRPEQTPGACNLFFPENSAKLPNDYDYDYDRRGVTTTDTSNECRSNTTQRDIRVTRSCPRLRFFFSVDPSTPTVASTIFFLGCWQSSQSLVSEKQRLLFRRARWLNLNFFGTLLWLYLWTFYQELELYFPTLLVWIFGNLWLILERGLEKPKSQKRRRWYFSCSPCRPPRPCSTSGALSRRHP